MKGDFNSEEQSQRNKPYISESSQQHSLCPLPITKQQSVTCLLLSAKVSSEGKIVSLYPSFTIYLSHKICKSAHGRN